MTIARYGTPNAQNEGVALAHTIHGEPQGATVRPEQFGALEGRIKPLPQAHRSNYSPPKRRHRDNPDRALCSEPECKAYPAKDLPYCTGHARHHGLMKSCSQAECIAPPKGGTKWCRWHQPETKEALSDDASTVVREGSIAD